MIYGKGVVNPSYRQRTMHHAMLLGGMAAITSALLVIGNKQTAPDIELRHAEDMKRSLAQVISPELHTNDLLKDVRHMVVEGETKNVYIAKSKDQVVAVAFETKVKGYAGPIDVMVGVNRNGQLLGTRILSHSETPGLGDKIEAEKDPWIFTFNGLSLTDPGESQWKVKKDGGYFDQFTGATITPRAVVKAVKISLEFFNANKATLLAITAPQTTPQTTPQDSKPASPATDSLPKTRTVISPEPKNVSDTHVSSEENSNG